MGISDAEREQRRELIQQHKPWLSSTGASTAAGKRRTRMNAFKTGFHSRDPKLAEQARRVQRELQEAERRARSRPFERAGGLRPLARQPPGFCGLAADGRAFDRVLNG